MLAEPLAATSALAMIDTDDTHIMSVGAPAAAPCRVLVVDDDELVLRRIASLLQLGGYEAHLATSGRQALRTLDETSCPIVLTDWHMPDMDGLELCRRLRARQASGYIYVLMLTVRSARGDIVAGLAAGADDYVVKGATAEELLARIGVGRRITYLERSLRASNMENRRIAVTDPLTGLRNRRFLMKYLPRELERAQRSNRPLALLSCDIDSFKKVNDTFGHEVGDQVLQGFARNALGCLRRSSDWITRSGGEEFVVVLPDTDLRGASCVGERLRNELAAKAIPTTVGPIAVTVSSGITAVEAGPDFGKASVHALLRCADQGLYASKKLGRDRMTIMPLREMPAVKITLPGCVNES
ncbi:MAG: diguanylate cyclase [Steroidobacteraceae bacterium]